MKLICLICEYFYVVSASAALISARSSTTDSKTGELRLFNFIRYCNIYWYIVLFCLEDRISPRALPELEQGGAVSMISKWRSNWYVYFLCQICWHLILYSTLTPVPVGGAAPAPTPQPTGAINTGFIVKTTYSDSYTCSTVSSVTLYRLGACIVSSSSSSYKYLNYDANTFASTGNVQVVYVGYSDGSCGPVSTNYNYFWSSSCYNSKAAYSASLPVLPPGVIAA